ncbi:LuxR family transcriptional regulator [Streptomyces ipomoeae]|nr:LuxR family transcriptional regulator [Streptomyces ipomoeae]
MLPRAETLLRSWLWKKAVGPAFIGVSVYGDEQEHGAGSPPAFPDILESRAAGSGPLGSLVERADAVATLNRLLVDAAAGHGRLAIVQGCRGTGKSRLVHDYLDAVAGPGVRTVAVTAVADDAAVPFGALRRLLAGTPLPPPLRDRRDVPSEEEMAADAHRLAEEITALAEHEVLVIAIDDAHHVDPESLCYLTQVLSRLRTARVLGILTHDLSHGATEPGRLLALYRTPGLGHITLHPLSLDGVATLAAHHFGDTPVHPHVAELFLRSGGNPLILQTMLLGRAGADGAPGPSPRTDGSRALRTAATPTVEVATEAAALHRRTAEFLYERGASAGAVAKHLVSAAWANAPWAVATLRAAAREAVLDGRVPRALRCLDLALGGSADARERAAVRATAAQLEWRYSPTTAARHLADQRTDFFAGHLGDTEVSDLLWRLAWYGHADDAVAVLEALRGTHPQYRHLADWLRHVYPEHAARLDAPRRPTSSTLRPDGAETGDPAVVFTADLVRAMRTGPSRATASVAELTLQTTCLDADSVWSGTATTIAVLVLIQADQLGTAQAWCDKLLDDPALDDIGTVWRAVLTALRAEVALRRGDLTTAHDHARRALDLVPAQGWGALLGLPVACAVRAAVRLGRIDNAAGYLRTVVPDAMARSRHELGYLYARGEYRLAAGRPHAALADFRACEALLTQLGPDFTGRVPWELGAAVAWLVQGNKKEVRALLRPLLDRHSLTGRERGIALRLLGRAVRPERGVHLLIRAVGVLEDHGDKFELAAALADLGDVHEQLGNQRLARDTVRRAWALAREAGALWLCHRVMPDGTAAEPCPGRVAALTEQERRVAILAGGGATNREISERLHITASTVEQHLTRVYRKLRISGRRELPPWLPTDERPTP